MSAKPPIYVVSDQGNGAYGTANHGIVHGVGTPPNFSIAGVGPANAVDGGGVFPNPGGDALQLENGDYLLLENGDNLLLE